MHVSDMKLAQRLGRDDARADGQRRPRRGPAHASRSTTSLTQDLAPLSTIPERFKGRGQGVRGRRRHVAGSRALPRARGREGGGRERRACPRRGRGGRRERRSPGHRGARGRATDGVALQRSEKRSPYSMLRFADQHPLLSRSGFLSIAQPQDAVRVDRAARRQPGDRAERRLAPPVRDGRSRREHHRAVRRSTGTGPKSTLELHVRASGVQSSHGEPFDGNIAVAISAADRTIEGRAEILRIGERHLLDLLDLQDPLHVDPAMNRIRTRARLRLPGQPAAGLRPRLRERAPGARRARAPRQHRRAARHSDGAHRRQDARARARRARHEGNAMNRVVCSSLLVVARVSPRLPPGCFKPPEIVMVDRATALEQQAVGVVRRHSS